MATVELTEPEIANPALPVAAERLHRFTVDDFWKMVEAGVFKREDRVFLWKGLIVTKMTKARPHTVVTTRLYDALKSIATGVGYVDQEQPVRLLGRDNTLPEPDVKVIRGRDTDYADIPTTADVPLVVEVADSSVWKDRHESIPLYAAEGIPVCWLANIPQRRIEVYNGPTANGYGPPTLYERGQSVPVVLDGVEVGRLAVSDIFGENDPWLRAAEA